MTKCGYVYCLRGWCVWERETGSHLSTLAILIAASVWEWERVRDRVTSQYISYLNRGLCVRVRESERERERERERVTSQYISYLNRGLCVRVRERARERERERERERDRVTSQYISYLNRGLCVRVRESERVRDSHSVQRIRNSLNRSLCERVRESERAREREREMVTVYSASEIVLIAACLQIHKSIITVSVTRLCSPLGLNWW